MNRIIRAIIAVLMLATAAFAFDKPLGPEEFTSVDDLAFAISSYFPKIQGTVKAIQGESLTISLGRKDGTVPGMVLSLWREGADILHPVTGAVIGKAEEEIGSIQVTAVAEATSTAVMKSRKKDPQAGDRCRLTPKKINLAVLPLGSERPDVVQGLVDRLNEQGRFTVFDQKKTAEFLKTRKQRDPSLVTELASAYNLDAVAALTLIPADGKLLVACRLYYGDQTQPLDTIVAMLALTSKREALGDVRPFFAPVIDTGERTPDLPAAARYLAVADVDGDGAPEYILSEETKLRVLRLEAAGWKELWSEAVPSAEQGMQQIRIDAADVNGNGKAEIFVTRMLGSAVSSYVIEYQDGMFRRIADLPGFLRVVSVTGKGSVLVGQDYNPDKFFSGLPKEYRWNGKTYEAGNPLPVPKGMGIYDFVFAELGDRQPVLVAFDAEDHLVVYSGGSPVWRSEEQYFAVDTVVTKPLTGLDALGSDRPDYFRMAGAVDTTRQVHLHGRMVAADIDGNGRDEIIIARNKKQSLITSYSDGEVHVLVWTGSRFEPRWNVKDLPGAVLDVAFLRQDKVPPVQALLRISGGVFGKDVFRIERYADK